jgi:ribosomal protein S18 acetylase RimI-like enzyme
MEERLKCPLCRSRLKTREKPVAKRLHTIRQAKPHDLEELLRIENSSFSGDRLTRKRMQRLMASPTCRFTVEEHEGQVRGMAVLLFKQGGRSTRLYSLATDDRQRGAGVASALLEEVERWSHREGFDRLSLEVRDDNAAAIGFYERRGYQRGKDIPAFYEDGHTARRYVKDLWGVHRCPSRLAHLHALGDYDGAPVGRADTLVSAALLHQAIGAIMERITLDREHDIPYLAGYSRDGKIIYIDRHVPKTFTYRGREVRVDPYLILHEAVEKTLIDELGLAYQHAHQIALRAEQALVRSTGVSWREYDRVMQSCIKEAGDEGLARLPADLDLKPYRDEEDLELLKRMMQSLPDEGRPKPAKRKKK